MKTLIYTVLQLLYLYIQQCEASGKKGNLEEFSKLLSGYTKFIYDLKENLSKLDEDWVKDFSKEFDKALADLKGEEVEETKEEEKKEKE